MSKFGFIDGFLDFLNNNPAKMISLIKTTNVQSLRLYMASPNFLRKKYGLQKICNHLENYPAKSGILMVQFFCL